ncbi:MAG: LamG domain-containing protein [Planctomycetota bacterium]
MAAAPGAVGVIMRSLLLSFLCLGLGAAASRAQGLLAYEPFDYGVTAGSTPVIKGAAGGFGWFGGWEGPSHLATGLASWWPLDGHGFDLGPLAAHGIEVNASYGPSPSPLTWSTSSLAANGASYIDLSAHVATFATMLRGSITAWVRTTDQANDQTILSLVDTTTPDDKHARMFLRNGTLSWDVRGEFATRGRFIGSGGVSLADGNWHHLAVTSHGDGNALLYLDGARVGREGEEGFLGYVRNPNRMFIGYYENLGGPQFQFNGDIDDVAIWDDALDPADVALLASGGKLPLHVSGPRRSLGPALSAGSLATATAPSSSFGSRGWVPDGGGFRDDLGNRGIRGLSFTIDLDNDASHFLSFLVRRDDQGGEITPFELQFSGPRQLGTRIGWDVDGNWVGGNRVLVWPGTASPVAMKEKTTYFVVAQIRGQSIIKGNRDWLSFKAYEPWQTVHTNEERLAGQGVGPSEWTFNRQASSQEFSDALFLTLYRGRDGGDSVVEIDEIRIGKTWDSVTRAAYGTSCAGLAAGLSGRPSLGSTFSLDLTGAQSAGPAMLMIGVSRDLFRGLSLPLDLAPAGAPGCQLAQSFNLALPAGVGAGGAASLQFAVPGNPTLLSKMLFTQWAAVPTTGAPALGLGLSDGVEITIGR